MTIADAAEKISGRIVTATAAAGREVRGGYVSDLLSDVMANSRENDLWITLQKHINIVAVAQLSGLAGIVLIGGRQPEAAAMELAEAEQVPIICTDLPAFETAGLLYEGGLRGRRSS